MLNPQSKTMREFTFTVNHRKGEQLTVIYGYDTSGRHSGFFISGSINGGKLRNDDAIIRKIKALGIPAINQLIDAIGTDVTGAPYEFDTLSAELLQKYYDGKCDIDTLCALYRVPSTSVDGGHSEESLELHEFTCEYATQQRVSAKNRLLTRFNNSHRVRMIDLTRDLVRNLREFYTSPEITYKGKSIIPATTGLLAMEHNPLYYKRDMDYIRKARIRLFKNTLKRKYRPF